MYKNVFHTNIQYFCLEQLHMYMRFSLMSVIVITYHSVPAKAIPIPILKLCSFLLIPEINEELS